MTKQNFIALANMLEEHNRVAKNNEAHTAFTQDQIEALADFCKRQNSAFKRERWLGYIAGTNGPNGGGQEKKKPIACTFPAISCFTNGGNR